MPVHDPVRFVPIEKHQLQIMSADGEDFGSTHAWTTSLWELVARTSAKRDFVAILV